MSRYASVVIRNPCKTKKPTPHNLRHNSRLTPDPNYMLPRELRLKNYNLYTISDATKTWDEWQTEIGDLYKEQHPKARQIRSDAVRLDEGLIVLSEDQVDNCNPDDIWEKMQEYINWFEERFLTVVYTLDWHRDEGHSEEDLDEIQKLETRNNHAHFIFSNVDSNGDMIRRTWDKKGTEFKEMQDQIAKIFKPLGFVRGINYAKKKILPPEYKTPSENRREKSKETRKKDKTEIKNLTDMLNQEKEKKWQQRLKKLREKMQLEKANRSKYAELEALLKTDAINYKNAEIEVEARAENVIWDMKAEYEHDKQVLQAEVTEKVKELKDSKEVLDTKNTKIETDLKTLNERQEKIDELESVTAKLEIQYKENIEVKDNELRSLNQQIDELKNQKPVIKEIPAKITIADVRSFIVKEDGENITLIDLFNRKNKAIKELKELNTRLSTKIIEKDAHIADLEKEIESDEARIYTGEIYEVLDVSETYTDEVHETWREKAKELEEKVEELNAEVSQLQKVIDEVKGLISKVFSAFGVDEDEPDGLEKINKRLATMESLKSPKKENSQPINQNTTSGMKP